MVREEVDIPRDRGKATSNRLRPAPSSRLLNLTGFFSGRGFAAATADIFAKCYIQGALTKGIGCSVARR
jgi:hypothetical protein